MNNIFKTKKTVFDVHLFEVGDEKYKLLKFIVNRPLFWFPSIDVEVYVKAENESGILKSEEYFNLSASSLGYYDNLAMERRRMSDVNDEYHYKFINAKYQINALFDIMSVLTNYIWYY